MGIVQPAERAATGRSLKELVMLAFTGRTLRRQSWCLFPIVEHPPVDSMN